MRALSPLAAKTAFATLVLLGGLVATSGVVFATGTPTKAAPPATPDGPTATPCP